MPGSASQPPDSYAVKDLAGCTVVTETGEVLGQLEDVLPSGGNDIFVVRKEKREVLIPALKSIVREIDVVQKRIVVVLPTGLREIYEAQ